MNNFTLINLKTQMDNSLKDMFSKFTQEETDNIERHTSFQKTDIVAKILTKKTPSPGASLVNSTKHLRGKNIINSTELLQNFEENFLFIL